MHAPAQILRNLRLRRVAYPAADDAGSSGKRRGRPGRQSAGWRRDACHRLGRRVVGGPAVQRGGGGRGAAGSVAHLEGLRVCVDGDDLAVELDELRKQDRREADVGASIEDRHRAVDRDEGCELGEEVEVVATVHLQPQCTCSEHQTAEGPHRVRRRRRKMRPCGVRPRVQAPERRPRTHGVAVSSTVDERGS